MPAKTASKFPPAVILRAAFRRDALLRGRRVLPALAAIAALQGCVAAPQGCVAVGGTTRPEPPTPGEQLVDLKAALEAGAISETEYEAAKSQLLKRA